ncbi:MAG: hypothetical protein JSW23_01625 [Planctomycetota bacterium]|nr:MAG: hypothetical protein JSW23_01625 [Planctomycetota bacterium]
MAEIFKTPDARQGGGYGGHYGGGKSNIKMQRAKLQSNPDNDVRGQGMQKRIEIPHPFDDAQDGQVRNDNVER